MIAAMLARGDPDVVRVVAIFICACAEDSHCISKLADNGFVSLFWQILNLIFE
jgi:hypothetical protein